MNARPGFKLIDVMNRVFDVLGYERKKPPQLTRIVIVRVPEPASTAPARMFERPVAARHSRY